MVVSKKIIFIVLVWLLLFSKNVYSVDSLKLNTIIEKMLLSSQTCLNAKLKDINFIKEKIKSGPTSFDQAKIYMYYKQLAFSYQLMSDYNSSIFYGLQSLSYFNKYRGRAYFELLMLLANNNNELNKIIKAYHYLSLIPKSYIKTNTDFKIAKYYILSIYYFKHNATDSSMLFFFKFQSLVKSSRNKPDNYFKLSQLYFLQSKFFVSKTLLLNIISTEKELSCFQKLKYNLALAKVYLALEMPDSALKFMSKLQLLSKNPSMGYYKRLYYSEKKQYYVQKDSFKQAYRYLEYLRLIEDSLQSSYNKRNIKLIDHKLSLELTESQNLVLKHANQRKDFYLSTLSGLLLLLLFIGIYFFIVVGRNKTLNKKLLLINEELKTYSEVIMERALEQERLNAELSAMHTAYKAQIFEKEKVNKRLKVKSKALIDSLFYARNIQRALFPQDEIIKQNNQDSFILWRPKDVVSGDFYWFHRIGNFYYIAVGDCTGHGVPGAFMSLLGINYLNDILAKNGVLPPAKILDLLNQKILRSLNQKGAKHVLRDGMDISLIMLSLKSKTGFFAGAYNNLYHIHSTKEEKILHEYKADRRPIGLYGQYDKNFSEQSFNINKGDLIYLTTDGYSDQFGGNKQKKFMRKRFREFLTRITDYPMYLQKIMLNEKFMSWKGQNEQLDDVLIIGIKI